MKENIDGALFGLEVPTDVVDVAQQTYVGLDEDELALAVELLALGSNPVAGLLRSADEIDARLGGILGEGLECILADTIRSAHKDSYEARRQLGSYLGVG